MAGFTKEQLTVREVIDRYGHCIDLVSMDPHFHDISVGLFLKNRRFTVWTYSNYPGVEERLEQIRDRMVAWGEMVPAESPIQADYRVGELMEKPLRFMFMDAVEKDPTIPPPTDERIAGRDTKTLLTFVLTGAQEGGNYVYTVSAEGEAPRAEMRIRAVVGGYMRYASAQRIQPDKFMFPDGERHDGFARLLLSYARNVSGVENMLAADELQGQMTTQTLGFSRS